MNGMAHPSKLRVLLIEDDEDDYVLTRDLLASIGASSYDLDWVENFARGVEAISRDDYDACLIDYHLGERNGIDLIAQLVAEDCRTPLILLTGLDDRDVDLTAMRLGATDYLVKDEITARLLEKSIRYAIERKETEQNLASLTTNDPLTGLANRSEFFRRLEGMRAHAGRTGLHFAILFIDLDRFKAVNDTLGHAFGDSLLKQFADRLRGCVRETDLVARLSGDEFAVLASNIEDRSKVAVVAEKIVSTIAEPFELEGHSVEIGVSIGIIVYPLDEGDNETLLRNADQAMYEAKRGGGQGYQFFDFNLNAEMRHRREMEDDLRGALEKDEVFLHFQPQIDLATGTPVAAEALLRWSHERRGFIPPDSFIPIAESLGIMTRLGDKVLWEACTQCHAWQASGASEMAVSVNLSHVELLRTDIVGTMRSILETTTLAPSSLRLELTEEVINKDFERIVEILGRVRDLGVAIAIDDFGTGDAALTRLKRLPVDELKIDNALVAGLPDGGTDAAIVETIIRLADRLNLRVTAEGVENEAQLALLREMGCSHAQGFLIGPPMPAGALIEWVDTNGRETRVCA